MLLYEAQNSLEKDFVVAHRDINRKFPMHIHKSFELVAVTEGELTLITDSGSFNIKKGQAALVFPNHAHGYNTANYSNSFYYIFSISYVYDFYDFIKDKTCMNPVFEYVEKEDITKYFENGASNKYRTKSVLYDICASFLEYADLVNINGKTDQLINALVQYVQENFKDNISLKSAAKALGYDYNYLSGYLNDRLKNNFSAFLNGYRISHAEYLLLNTDKSITEIATLCGYDTIRSFNRNFIKITNTTPREFKKGEII